MLQSRHMPHPPKRRGAICGVCKIVMIGDSGVGKSSIVRRLVDDRFDDSLTDPTVGVDFWVKLYKLSGFDKPLKLTIWDTAGQERFRTLTGAYYRGVHGIVMVYDVGSLHNFRKLNDTWMKEVCLFCADTTVAVLLIGNKIDADDRQVLYTDGLEFSKEHGTLFMECSAKTREGIEEAFGELIASMTAIPTLFESLMARPTGSSISLLDEQVGATNARGCGC